MSIERRRRWIAKIEFNIAGVVGRSCWHKRMLYALRRLRRCPECRGKGTTPGQEWTGRPWMEYQVLVEEECPTCKGTGRI